MQWYTLFQKEMIENWRNRKWIWVPLVFILIAVMDPITFYFLPEIIEMTGGLPEGTILEFPDLNAGEVFATSLESLSMYGIIVLALFTMSMISGEEKSGVNEIILVKPVKFSHYMSAKWTTNLLLLLTSLVAGIGLSWYYVNLLFGDLFITTITVILILFLLWFAMFLSFSIFYNVLLKSPGAVAASVIATYFLFSAVDLVIGMKWSWFPNQLFMHIHQLLEDGKLTTDIVGTAIVITVLTIILLGISMIIFSRKRKMPK